MRHPRFEDAAALRSRISARPNALIHARSRSFVVNRCAQSFTRENVHISVLLVAFAEFSLLINTSQLAIVSLAARRKGIARSAVLHLDDARSAWGEVGIGSRRKAVLFRSDCGCRIAIGCKALEHSCELQS